MPTNKTQSLIISAACATLLLIVSFLSLYLYKFYVRPDLFVEPGVLKQETEIQKEKLNSNLLQVQSQYGIASVNLNSSNDRLKTKLSEPEILNPENPLKILFKKIFEEKVNNLSDSSQEFDETKVIDPIKFPSELVKISNVQLQHELPSQAADFLTSNSNEVSYSLVGLKLDNKTLVSSVYKIENLFSISGLVGHYYIIEKNMLISPRAQANQIDFSSKEKFISTSPAEAEFTSSEKFIDGYTVLFSSLSKSGKPIIENDLKRVLMSTDDLKKDQLILNPYKWHYMATKLKDISSFKLLSVLVYPTKFNTETKLKPIKYLAEVELSSKEILNNSKLDKIVYTGDLKRILNHCRDSVDSSIVI